MIRVLLLLSLLLLWLPGSVLSRVEGMNQRVFKAIDEAQQLMDAEDYDGALAKLKDLRERRLTSYETAHVLRFMGMVYYEREDIPEARAAHEEALAQERLPDPMVANLLGSLSRLALMQEDYAYAEVQLRRLLAIEDQNTSANQVLLAIAQLRQEKYSEARDLLLIAIGQERQKGKPPPENWLSMLASAEYALEDYEAMREVFRELVGLYPRERYLMNLAALHGQLGDRQRQLALVEALLDDDRLEEESHLKMLANLFLAEGLPYKAATLLQTGIDAGRIGADQRSLEMLSQAWYMAHEMDRALPALERASDLADTGELYLRLAGLYMDLNQWEAASVAAGKALERGGLRREGSAWLMRGMALVRLDELTDAVELFNRAAEFDESRDYADQWLKYVVDQRKMQAALVAAD
jgi:tetratricopeptide (TPR) repeat protein